MSDGIGRDERTLTWLLNAMDVPEKRWDEQGKVETLMCNVDDRCKLKKRSACNTSGWDRAARQG